MSKGVESAVEELLTSLCAVTIWLASCAWWLQIGAACRSWSGGGCVPRGVCRGSFSLVSYQIAGKVAQASFNLCSLRPTFQALQSVNVIYALQRI